MAAMSPSASPSIARLPEVVANKIAAGEVVERPANVVKELVENSIDAGASRITVRIEDGGRRLVEVVDDGHGIAADEVLTAFERHATSKLRHADDLFCIASLGFRGEALPSIAAVSECELGTRQASAEAGLRVVVAGGSLIAREPCGMPPGTRIRVRNLFWNTPVRLKFLKSRAAETGHVHDMILRLALAHPHIAFHLTSDSRTLVELPACDALLDRIRAAFSGRLADSLLPVVGDKDGAQLTGFIAGPQEAKVGGRRQYLFLNGRAINDPMLISAIREGYRSYVEPRLKGTVFLALNTDPGLIDVNVHPTKSEVRFRRSGAVFSLVRNAIATCLEEHCAQAHLLNDAPSRPAAPAPPAAPPAVMIQERFLPPQTGLDPTDDPPRRLGEAPSSAEPAAVTMPGPQIPGLRQIVQLADAYLLVETDQGLRIIDQHALHEKALYLQLCADIDPNQLGGRQELLIPQMIELEAAELAAAQEHLPTLAQRHVVAEVAGPSCLALHAVPAWAVRIDWQAFFTALARQGERRDPLAAALEAMLHRQACRAAVKAGTSLDQQQMQALVSLLYQDSDLARCPHGRPTTLDLSWSELERRFMR